MLDSLVRVSRRVGWGADRYATDPEAAREYPTRQRAAVREHWNQSTRVEQHEQGEGLAQRREVPRSERRRLHSSAITLHTEAELPCTAASRRRRTGRGARTREKVHPPHPARHAPHAPRGSGRQADHGRSRLNSEGDCAVPSVYL